MSPQTAQAAPEADTAIVGVGASAGGLDAYRQLLAALPVDTGMAFVLVQHLAPEHQSMLAEILGRVTAMPVTEVRDEPRVAPNHVYVIPPNRSMLLKDGHLKLVPRTDLPGRHRSVDTFLRSLAENQRHRAIGVILSGTGSDGTLGLGAIKAEGGITFAQDETAQQDGMPRSAITAGHVDYVLPPDQIAAELVRIGRHPYVSPGGPVDEAVSEAAADASELNKILRLLQDTTGVDFTLYKSTTLYRRITRRMLLRQLDGLHEYLRALQRDPGEIRALYHDILISVTAFFRDPACFEVIRTQVLPRLLSDRPRTEPLRVWTLGCSTGEEAYSLAITLAEFAAEQGALIPVQVFATDLNEQGIEKARAGLYPTSIAQDVSQERLRRFFVEVNGGYQIAHSIREMCVFARHNVATDPPFSRMDLISCRNLLIYMEPALQKRVVPMLHYALKPRGVLWLGMSESASGFTDLFEPSEPKYKIYTKKPVPVAVPAAVAVAPATWERQEFGRPGRRQGDAIGVDRQREADRVAIARYVPPGVLVNAELEVLQFRGDTSRYLAQAPGKPSLNVLKMAREGLLVGLRSALQKAMNGSSAARQEGLLVKTEGGFRDVAVEVIPVGGAAEERCYLVMFENKARVGEARTTARGQKTRADAAEPAALREAERQVARLTQELAATREYMQSLVEQKEAANEEMQSANEEIQSANEELQSVNEELQTSKEEIQSSNEELTTVNDELRHRNDQLDRAHDDLSNFVASSALAMVVVGVDLRIRRFTPAAEKLLNLIGGDVGRPLGDLKLPLDAPDLEARLFEVIDTVSPQAHEVQDRSGRWYSLRLRPYKTLGNTIDGAVLVLVDIEAQKRTQAELRASEEKYRLLVEGARGMALMLLDAAGRVTGWNVGAERIFGYSEAEIIGQHLSRFFEPDDLAAEWPERELEQARRGSDGPDDNWLLRKDGSRFWASGTTTALKDETGAIRGFSKVVRDTTDQKRSEEALKDSERRYRDLVHALPAAVYTCDRERRITLYNQAAAALWGRTPELGVTLWCGSWRMYRPDGTVLPPDECPMAVTLREGRAVRGEEIVIERPDGTRVSVMPYPEPIHDATGRVIGAINMLVDLTELHQAEQALRESEARLQAALSAAQMGTWLWYFKEDRQLLDESLHALMGLEPGEVRGLKDFLAAIHPEDQAAVQAAFYRSVQEKTELDIEFRAVQPNGGIRWLRDRGKIVAAKNAAQCLTGACVDITERREAEQALRDADSRKNEFLATLAHELRNPLAPLRTGLGLLQRASSDDTVTTTKAREMMERQLSHMVRLIDDLLDVSRITRGKVELKKERVQVQAVVEAAVEASRPAIDAERHAFTMSIPEAPLWIDADPTRMAQVVSNLLINAAKYTPAGGQIALTVEQDEEGAVIRVRDNGAGLRGEDLSKVFEMFTQVGRTTHHRAPGGLGIGLSLVKRLVEMHGGSALADSAGPGAGSVFTVRLPLATGEEPQAPARPTATKEAGAASRRILVVDDNVDAADSLAMLLQIIGHETRIAHSGGEALDVGRAFAPEVAFLDIGLPGMDGHELARCFRADPGLRDTTLIALTGWGTEDDKRKSQEAGFDFHLTKPVEAAAVEAALAGSPPHGA